MLKGGREGKLSSSWYGQQHRNQWKLDGRGEGRGTKKTTTGGGEDRGHMSAAATVSLPWNCLEGFFLFPSLPPRVVIVPVNHAVGDDEDHTLGGGGGGGMHTTHCSTMSVRLSLHSNFFACISLQ